MVLILLFCEVGYKDLFVFKFIIIVMGYLEKGKLSEVEGMKIKVMIWVKVISIFVDLLKVYFIVGMKKSRNWDVYEVFRDGVWVDKF